MVSLIAANILVFTHLQTDRRQNTVLSCKDVQKDLPVDLVGVLQELQGLDPGLSLCHECEEFLYAEYFSDVQKNIHILLFTYYRIHILLHCLIYDLLQRIVPTCSDQPLGVSAVPVISKKSHFQD